MADKGKKILIAASEFEPFTNIGHLGRVVSNLSVALNKRANVRVVIPMYAGIPRRYTEKIPLLHEFGATLGRRTFQCRIYCAEHRGVKVYLVETGSYFSHEGVYTSVVDDIERFSCFSHAVLCMLFHIDFEPDIIQCHDWQMSYIPILLTTNQHRHAYRKRYKTASVIHSMQFQGLCSRYDMLDRLDLPGDLFSPATLEFYGQANSLKGGLLFSDKLVTVSESYASEIQHAYYGENLEGIIRNRARDVTGIMCGIDNELYDPETDPGLCANFSAKTRARLKPENKLRLQKLLGLKQDRDVPLIAVTADNLDFDKGMDLIKHVFYDIVGLGAQLVFASKGPIVDYHDFFTAKALELPRQVAYGRFNGNIAETMFIGGADMLLRPSRVEPCGEKHLIALRYGTAPIVRETGGLKDVVAPLDDNTGEGNGFSFANYNAHDMLYTVDRALSVYRGDRKAWGRLIDRGMALRLSWDDTAGKYMRVYDSLREEAAADDD